MPRTSPRRLALYLLALLTFLLLAANLHHAVITSFQPPEQATEPPGQEPRQQRRVRRDWGIGGLAAWHITEDSLISTNVRRTAQGSSTYNPHQRYILNFILIGY